MIEKALMVIIFMYASSFAMLGIQYSIGDVYGITLTGADGTAIRSSILDYINEDAINVATDTTNGTKYNQTQFGAEPVIAAAGLVVEIFLILTGTYVFNVLFHVIGIPTIWLAGLVILYMFLMMRTIVAYLRGI